MLQIILSMARSWTSSEGPTDPECWRFDPLSHPALKTMNPTQLADLPISHEVLPRHREECGC